MEDISGRAPSALCPVHTLTHTVTPHSLLSPTIYILSSSSPLSFSLNIFLCLQISPLLSIDAISSSSPILFPQCTSLHHFHTPSSFLRLVLFRLGLALEFFMHGSLLFPPLPFACLLRPSVLPSFTSSSCLPYIFTNTCLFLPLPH